VLPPIGVAIADSWFDVTRNLSLPNNTVWKLLIERITLDPLPTTVNVTESMVQLGASMVSGTATPGVFDATLQYLKMPGLWVGAVIGAAFIAGAIYLRRKSEDAY
jgi:ABC-2 type transport system permease protein